MLTGVLLSVVLSVMLSACVDELDPRTDPNVIRFGLSLSDQWTDGTRALSPTHHEILSAKNTTNGKEMFLHAVVEDWEGPSMYESPQNTRANIVHDANDMHSTISVCAHHYDTWSNDVLDAKIQKYFFENITANKTDAGFEMSKTYHWPKTGKMLFTAFAPATGPGIQYDIWHNYDGPAVDVDIQPNVADQVDLLVANTGEIDCASPSKVPLHFKHAMTAVQFVLADDLPPCVIQSVTLRNVYRHGLWLFRNNDASAPSASGFGSWHNHRDVGNVTQEINHTVGETSVNEYIVQGNKAFIMIPGSLPESAEVQIVIKQIGAPKTETIFGYLKGQYWPAGKIVTYRVSYKNWWQGIYASDLPSISYLGGEETMRINLFDISMYDIKRRPVKWKMKFKDEGQTTFSDTPPAWFSVDKSENPTGDTIPQQVKFTISAQTNPILIDQDEELRGEATKGTKENPWNLAKASGALSGGFGSVSDVQNTANCYVVNAPGWYILPAVYGNAIKDGADNKRAYQYLGGTAPANVLQKFINHLGNEIERPFITDNAGCENVAGRPHKANHLWNDSRFLIGTMKWTSTEGDFVGDLDYIPEAYGGKGGIRFCVNQSTIHQGNAVITLTNGTTGEVMWSWHIWVTHFLAHGDQDIEIFNKNNEPHVILNTNVGWVSHQPLEIYHQRRCDLRIEYETVDGQTGYLDRVLLQRPVKKYWPGHNTYYQWGRKDPFAGAAGEGPTWQCYAFQNYAYSEYWIPAVKMGQGLTALRNRTLNPIAWHQVEEVNVGGGTYEGYDETFYNLWDSQCSEVYINDLTSVAPESPCVKTIYDPCPVGYKVPPLDTFTGFTTTGNNTNFTKRFDSTLFAGEVIDYTFYSCWPDVAPRLAHGFEFYLNQAHKEAVAMPMTGYRDWRNGGTPLQYATDGYYWTSMPRSTNQAYYFCCMWGRSDMSPHVNPLNWYFHTDGFPIRPIKE